MENEFEIVDVIKKVCGNAEYMSPLGWHFIFNEKHFFYTKSNGKDLIRFSIPHLFYASDYDEARLTVAINERTILFFCFNNILNKESTVKLAIITTNA